MKVVKREGKVIIEEEIKEKESDLWRLNLSTDSSGDIYYCRKKGVVKARRKGRKWITRKVYDVRDAFTVGGNIIDSQSIK